jgi:hypothetical protein
MPLSSNPDAGQGVWDGLLNPTSPGLYRSLCDSLCDCPAAPLASALCWEGHGGDGLERCQKLTLCYSLSLCHLKINILNGSLISSFASIPILVVSGKCTARGFEIEEELPAKKFF